MSVSEGLLASPKRLTAQDFAASWRSKDIFCSRDKDPTGGSKALGIRELFIIYLGMWQPGWHHSQEWRVPKCQESWKTPIFNFFMVSRLWISSFAQQLQQKEGSRLLWGFLCWEISDVCIPRKKGIKIMEWFGWEEILEIIHIHPHPWEGIFQNPRMLQALPWTLPGIFL